MSIAPGSTKSIFISYSHQDKRWLDYLKTFLSPITRTRDIDPWDDTRILPGDIWRDEIQKALDAAEMAILLVSPDFLASKYIHDNELPPLLDAAKAKGLRIYWIAVSSCPYQHSPIEAYQAANDPARPLDALSKPDRNQVLTTIVDRIAQDVHP